MAAKKAKQKRFYIEVQLYARGKRRKASVSAGFIPRLPDGKYDTGETLGQHGLREEDYEMWARVDAALREFCQHLIDEGEL